MSLARPAAAGPLHHPRKADGVGERKGFPGRLKTNHPHHPAKLDGVGIQRLLPERAPVAGEHASPSGCVLLPDGETVISGGYDGQLLWHRTGPRAWTVQRVQAHDFWSWQLALPPDGTRAASVTGQYLPGGWKYEPAASPEHEAAVKAFDARSGALRGAFVRTARGSTALLRHRADGRSHGRQRQDDVAAVGLAPRRAAQCFSAAPCAAGLSVW